MNISKSKQKKILIIFLSVLLVASIVLLVFVLTNKTESRFNVNKNTTTASDSLLNDVEETTEKEEYVRGRGTHKKVKPKENPNDYYATWE